MSRFKCSRCGVEATRIGGEHSYVPSVQADEWASRCVLAAAAVANGEVATPMSVNCPYLRGDASAADEEALALAASRARPPARGP